MQGIQSSEINKRYQALNGSGPSAGGETTSAAGEKLFSEFSSVLDKIAVALSAAEVDSAGLHDTLFDELAATAPVAPKQVAKAEPAAAESREQQNKAEQDSEVAPEIDEPAQEINKPAAGSDHTPEKKKVAKDKKSDDKEKLAAQEENAAEDAAAEDAAAAATEADVSAESKKNVPVSHHDTGEQPEQTASDEKVETEATAEQQTPVAQTPVADTNTANVKSDAGQKEAKAKGDQVVEQAEPDQTQNNADSRSDTADLMKSARQQVADNKKNVQPEQQPAEQETTGATPDAKEARGDDVVKQFMESLRSRLQSSKSEVETTQAKVQKVEVTPQVPVAQTPQPQPVPPAALQMSLALKTGVQAGTAEAAKGLQLTAQNATSGVTAVNAGREQNSSETKEGQNTQRLPRNYESRTLAKVEEALKEVARSKDGKTISVRLDPPSLGKVQIDVSMRDGILHARLQADSGQVSSLLREHGLDLQVALRKLGLEVDEVQVVVREGHQEQQQSFEQYTGQRGSQREDAGSGDLIGEEAEVAVVASENNSSGSLNIEDHWVA